MMIVLSMAIVSMIMIIQYPTASAGGCIDEDGDNYWANIECRPNLDPDDNNPCNPDPNSVNCNPMVEMENLVADVVVLIEDGNLDINEGQRNAILEKLQNAVDRAESDNTNAAINSLNAFINQINAFINAGSISQLDGDALIDGAQIIINAL